MLHFVIQDASPPVRPENIYWTFVTNNGSVSIEPSSRFQFSTDRLTLTINEITDKDEGFYLLFASNPAGSDEGSLFLEVQGKFIIPSLS